VKKQRSNDDAIRNQAQRPGQRRSPSSSATVWAEFTTGKTAHTVMATSPAPVSESTDLHSAVCAGVDTGIWFSEGASGLPVESIAIAIILLLNASLRVYQESKSEAVLGLRDEIGFTLLQNGIPLIVTIYRKADNAFEMGTKVKDSLLAKLQYQ
jgi:hypothetical protein